MATEAAQIAVQNAIADRKAAYAYLLAGYARCSVTSLRTGARFNYTVKRKQGVRKPTFVRALVGQSYEYVGYIRGDGKFVTDKNLPEKLERYVAPFKLLWDAVAHKGPHWERMALCADGICSACGRPLKDPKSTARGLGPDCAQRHGLK